jgi:hypothetical protein
MKSLIFSQIELAAASWHKIMQMCKMSFFIQVKYWLSHIQTFSEYPRRMQQKLIKVGWYERYEKLLNLEIGKLFSQHGNKNPSNLNDITTWKIRKNFDILSVCKMKSFCSTCSHAAKRVLIRQGHRPQAFYFLLSGSGKMSSNLERFFARL